MAIIIMDRLLVVRHCMRVSKSKEFHVKQSDLVGHLN